MGVRRIARLHIPGVNDSFFVGQTPDSAAAYRQHRLYSQASFAQAGRGGSDARVGGDLSGSEDLYSSEAGGGVFSGITPAEFSLLTLESAAQVRHYECCFLAPAVTWLLLPPQAFREVVLPRIRADKARADIRAGRRGPAQSLFSLDPETLELLVAAHERLLEVR